MSTMLDALDDRRCRTQPWADTKTRITRNVGLRLRPVDESAYHQLFVMAKKHAAVPASEPKKKTEEPGLEHDTEARSITTAIHIPENTWKLLRAVAFHRAQDQGGRASVSKLIVELVERHREELEHETKG
jgi:hypothetical protein